MTKILVFGGNGFLGGETVVELLAMESFDITVVNRGNWNNYDSNIRIRPFVKSIHVDRKASNAIEQLRAGLGDTRFDAVIDFSAYDSDVVKDALDVLQDQIQLYIYISTDSVYEVCLPVSDELSSETDCRRPSDPNEYERLRRKDSYGHKKLKVEEKLQHWQNKSKTSWSYVILRLPDVLGPRDSTDRWWFYQMWIQFYSSVKKPLEFSTNLRSSYVYVTDVARYVSHILSQTLLNRSSTFRNQILNIACEEVIPVHQLLTMMISELDLTSLDIPIKYNPNTDADFFPSVTRGGISISKAASETFRWRPTPLRQVVGETIQWYNDAYGSYRDERSHLVKRLRRTLLRDDEAAYGKFLFAIDEYSTRSTIKRKREDHDVENEMGAKRILVLESQLAQSEHGDHPRPKHDDL